MWSLLARDWIDLKIDTDRMANGAAVAKQLRKARGGGIPWIVILDASGEQLVTGDGPEGNIGCPVTEAEARWFFSMLETTRQHSTDAGLAQLRAEHDAFVKPIRARRNR